MVAWIKAQWGQLPHQLQAAIAIFGSAIFVEIGQNAMAGTTCASLACIKARIPEMLRTGIVALFAFYMKPNKGNGNAPPQQP
jgi:hypothetical protein